MGQRRMEAEGRKCEKKARDSEPSLSIPVQINVRIDGFILQADIFLSLRNSGEVSASGLTASLCVKCKSIRE